MFCSNCGANLRDGTKFCPYCGQKVRIPEPVPTPVAAPAEPELTRPEAFADHAAPAPKAEGEPSLFRHPSFEEPAAPVFEEPAAPEAPVFEEPEAPVFEEPAAPVFEEPEAPIFEAPAAPVFEEPETPVFEAPAAPEAPVFEEPTVPETPVFEEPAAPERPVFEEPVTPVYAAPATDMPAFTSREPEHTPKPVRTRQQPTYDEPVDEPAFLPEKEPEIPRENRPLSPWAYFGFSLLFSIPVIGLILLIVLSFAPRNVNLKNFARSYWCAIALVVVIVLAAAVLLLTGVLKGPIETGLNWLKDTGLGWLMGKLAA